MATQSLRGRLEVIRGLLLAAGPIAASEGDEALSTSISVAQEAVWNALRSLDDIGRERLAREVDQERLR